MNTNNIYLVNHRPKNCEPLMSITRLPKKEAFKLAKKLYEENPCAAYRRFSSDFEFYYPERMNAEKWLYEKFIEIGGKPQTMHPIYFYVHGWDMVPKFWGDYKTIKLSLNEIDICDVSFTVGDSCGEHKRHGTMEIFLKDGLLKRISSFDNDVEKYIESVKQQIGNGIVEAQIWNDKYFLAGGTHFGLLGKSAFGLFDKPF